jgi:hypothetical protein
LRPRSPRDTSPIVQFVQFIHRSGADVATKRGKRAHSPKAAEIVRLVEALTTGVGAHDGVVLGRGIADLLRDAYRERQGSVPRWVRELIVYYAREKRAR